MSNNPSHDMYGVNSGYDHKHWGCDQVIIDARTKPHQAPPLIPDASVEKSIDGASITKEMSVRLMYISNG